MTVMTTCVPTVEHLVVAIFVRDARRSKAFYQQLGFEVQADRATFVVLTWAGHELFLEERPTCLCRPPARRRTSA
jgi:catechol 2,3-dioxygenase-like lactoylglutathione lyase family enzyme